MGTSQNKELFVDYEGFVEKFKPKKTTDDCMTPVPIYEAVKAWACERYGVDPDAVVRPFWPGADYTKADYEGKAVIDNPPFSILTKICAWYDERGIKYFLFAPHLTLMGAGRLPGRCLVVASAKITYENGAQVRTSFVTNMDTNGILLMSAPDLYEAVDRAAVDPNKVVLPKYEYPWEVVTSTRLGRLSERGLGFEVKASEARFIRGLDAQKEMKKTIFGSGFLISHEKAEELKALSEEADRRVALSRTGDNPATGKVFQLSDAEEQIIASLG